MSNPRLPAGVAAGHPATVDAGIEILEAGGTAADAAVAACLASCVAETVMTGLLGGGHAIWYEAGQDAQEIHTLDFFVAVPGLGTERREPELLELEVPFGTELVHYAVGIASCAVPGVPAGLDDLWSEHGRLPWKRLVAPALRLARSGVRMPPAHAACLAMLAPVMTMREGERIYAPGGRLLEAWDVLHQPGLVEALEVVEREGARTVYEGTIAERLLALVEERGGLITRADLESYAPRWRDAHYAHWEPAWVFSRSAALASPLEALERLPRLRGASPGERALALVSALARADAERHTTNLTVVDRDGRACVLTTSLGLGSGDWLPGLDLHLNSMLGEADLLRGPLAPGARMESMMAPTIALERDGAAALLAAGAAGGTRLRSALVQVLVGVLEEGVDVRTAVERPRLHPVGEVVHAEPRYDERALAELAAAGYEIRRWAAPHHYFGGVSAIARSGAAGDPRRSGAARLLP